MSPIAGQFSARTIAMLESPAYRALSRAAHQVLTRIEIEHAHHGGKDNGRLPVTSAQFVEYGIHRHAIAPAIRELVALGFIEITREGRAGNADWRRPTLFRLTYRHSFDLKPTNEWRKITEADANALAKIARRTPSNFFHSALSVTNPLVTVSAKPSAGNRHLASDRKRTNKSKNAQKSVVPENGTTSRLSLHLAGRGSHPQQQPHDPPDPADAEPRDGHPDPEPGDGLDIPAFLRRDSR